MVNELLVEINEPEVTTISGALGIQKFVTKAVNRAYFDICLLYTSPSPRDRTRSRMPSSA